MKNSTRRRLERKAQIWKHLIANHIFVDWLYKRPLDETCARILKYTGVLKRLKAYTFVTSPHLRGYDYTGDLVYGYTSIEQVEARLDYISDRFVAPCRLSWMIELPARVQGLPLEDKETD